MPKYNLKDVKYMHYLDYKLNNTPSLMKRYRGIRYPRLVEFLVSQEGSKHALTNVQAVSEAERIFKTLWIEGLFHSCQA